MDRKTAILIGVDFDNTIISYDKLFLETAITNGLVPPEMPADKNKIRNFLRDKEKEDRWTLLQGEVYGKRLNNASVFPGVKKFFRFCLDCGIGICIVSHKTRIPYLGPKYDLHRAANDWLDKEGFFSKDKIGLDKQSVYFELTKANKISRIGSLGCSHYIDDLPEILSDERFPGHVQKLLFDYSGKYTQSLLDRFLSWDDILAYFIHMSQIVVR